MEALVMVDLQNDFLPGGALAVPEGDMVVPVANRLQAHFGLVLATQDWHPPDHGSFATSHPGAKVGETVELAGIEQILWPPHCIQDSPGAAFAPDLETKSIAAIFHKGSNRDVDSYSAFFDNAQRRATGLYDYLKQRQVTGVVIVGLALDYCVKLTALDALELGLDTTVVSDATRAVNLDPGDGARAIEALRAAGAIITTSEEILRRR